MSDQALGLIIMAIMAWGLVCGIPMLIASRLAYNRGRSRGGAATLAFFFGWLALPFVACMSTDWRVVDQRQVDGAYKGIVQANELDKDKLVGWIDKQMQSEIPRRRVRR